MQVVFYLSWYCGLWVPWDAGLLGIRILGRVDGDENTFLKREGGWVSSEKRTFALCDWVLEDEVAGFG